MKSKSPLARLKPIYDHGKLFASNNPKISFAIKNYAITTIFKEYKQNKNSMSPTEVTELEKLIKDLSVEKKAIGAEATCAVEEYSEFLENLFANVDDEDRTKEVTMKTSASFRLISELIDVLSTWGPIPDDITKLSKRII